MTKTESQCDTAAPAHPRALKVESPMSCAFTSKDEAKDLHALGREFDRLSQLLDDIDRERGEHVERASSAIPRPRSLVPFKDDRALFDLYGITFDKSLDAVHLESCIRTLNARNEPGMTDAQRYRRAELTATFGVYWNEILRAERAAAAEFSKEYDRTFARLKAIGRTILNLPALTSDELAVKAAVVKFCAGGEWEVNWKTDTKELEFEVAVYSFMRDYFAMNDLPGAPLIGSLPAVAAESSIAA